MVVGRLGDLGLVAMYRKTDRVTLAGDCWPVQIEGTAACEGCQVRWTKECGGGEALRRATLEERNRRMGAGEV